MFALGRRFRLNQDSATGLLFVLFACFFLWFGRDIPIGEASEMGPGYMPQLLGWLLAALGLVMVVKGVASMADELETWTVMPLLLVCGSFCVFAWLISSAGVIVTTFICVLCAAAGGPEFRLREQFVVACIASICAALLFVWLLGLPMKYLPDWAMAL